MISRSKKGFTLVEIIAVVAIIAVLGVASFFGIRLVSKNITISKLEKITDKVLLAAEVYIETNKETYNQLYNEENSVIIPLNVLVNEGLLTLENTNISSKNIENEYIIATLANGGGNDTDCIDITTNASWNLSIDNPIYICNNKSSGTNSIIIGGTNSNIDTVKVQEEVSEADGRYKFSNFDSTAENYLTYSGKTFRILEVDRDDSVILYSKDTFGDTFKNRTQNFSSCPTDTCAIDSRVPNQRTSANYFSCKKTDEYFADNKCQTKKFASNTVVCEGYSARSISSSTAYPTGEFYINTETTNNGEVNLSSSEFFDLNNKVEVSKGYIYWWWDYGNKCEVYNTGRGNYPGPLTITVYENKSKKIKLKSCMKITGGTGTSVNPYELSDLC